MTAKKLNDTTWQYKLGSEESVYVVAYTKAEADKKFKEVLDKQANMCYTGSVEKEGGL